MYRLLILFLSAVSLSAQSTASSQVLDKPPQDVDDALRARIKQFYDFHVAGKYRQAEDLVAEESKDDFFSLNKPEIHAYKVGNIEYSDHFTKAKAVIVGSMPVLIAWAGGKIMDMPFASFWKIENGQWCWYYNREALRQTPFGEVKTPPEPRGKRPTSLPVMPAISIADLQSALKIDRTHVDLTSAKSETVRVTNTLPGPATLSIVSPQKPLAETGIQAAFDKKDLKGGETAILTLGVGPEVKAAIVPLQIVISPTNQILNFTVNVSR